MTRTRQQLRVAAGALTVVVLALTGCTAGSVDGDGGDVTDARTPSDGPVTVTPREGTCHHTDELVADAAAYQPVDCDRPHLTETVHVGVFTGEHAAHPTVPSTGSTGRGAARAECDQRAAEFLGDVWQAGRLSLRVVVPSQAAWNGGDRWFRCDLGEVGLDDGELAARSGSLAGTLSGEAPLRLGCFAPEFTDDGSLDALPPTSCDEPHSSEFVGTYVEDGQLTLDEAFSRSDAVNDRCLGVVAAYANVPADADLQYRVGSFYVLPYENEWDEGDRRIRCFAWQSDPPLTRSVRGGGTPALPIRYG
ncbi:septum formation family protein [Solwaraspora sp. WMMD791]|uniref:septum formation family protein n=1 Tax=Solwaraspora sp. WMMD791 TaxID=3016086 RepID=UPI00249C3046|nr:septum formation family protein [Solwaraspora sp. WMMD791]WFE28830.1 septum formation family protein [Solwaraspora sp. WMMD791]